MRKSVFIDRFQPGPFRQMPEHSTTNFLCDAKIDILNPQMVRLCSDLATQRHKKISYRFVGSYRSKREKPENVLSRQPPPLLHVFRPCGGEQPNTAAKGVSFGPQRPKSSRRIHGKRRTHTRTHALDHRVKTSPPPTTTPKITACSHL